jgi:uncharacterized protein HemX
MEDNGWVLSDGCGCEGWGGDANMTKGRALLWGLALLVLLAFAAGCGLVSDQTKQEAKQKLEERGQQARQEASTRGEAKREEVQQRVESGQEDLKKEVDDLQLKLDDVQKKLDEVLKKLEAQKQPEQEEKK